MNQTQCRRSPHLDTIALAARFPGASRRATGSPASTHRTSPRMPVGEARTPIGEADASPRGLIGEASTSRGSGRLEDPKRWFSCREAAVRGRWRASRYFPAEWQVGLCCGALPFTDPSPVKTYARCVLRTWISHPENGDESGKSGEASGPRRSHLLESRTLVSSCFALSLLGVSPTGLGIAS